LARRVVVTGIGLICGVGNTTEEVWNNLLAGNGATQSSSIKMRRTTAQVAVPKLVGEPEAKPTSAPTFRAVLGPGPRVERTK
jgi:3-oxoacyl-(acyl-carrier-protein) synthase